VLDSNPAVTMDNYPDVVAEHEENLEELQGYAQPSFVYRYSDSLKFKKNLEVGAMVVELPHQCRL